MKQVQLFENNGRCYFYKKNRREYEPVNDITLNEQAKAILERFYEDRHKYQIPKRLIDKWDKVALFSSTGNVLKASALYIIDEETTFDIGNKLNDLTSKEWLSETVTVFTQKGLGAGSKDAQIERLHPAPFSFQDVAKLIRYFTKGGGKVLDPFVGVGSTLKACAFEGREGYGIELNPKYHSLIQERIDIEVPFDLAYKNKQHAINADCREAIDSFDDEMFDFIITSPPYWNILETVDHKVKQNRVEFDLDIKYSTDEKDLGNIEGYEEFLEILSDIFDRSARILKSRKYLCVIVSDFRKKEKYHLFHADIARAIETKGNFTLKGIRILHQKFKGIYPYGYPFSFVPNVHHQNVLIFQKVK